MAILPLSIFIWHEVVLLFGGSGQKICEIKIETWLKA